MSYSWRFAQDIVDEPGLSNPCCYRSSHRRLHQIDGLNCAGVHEVEILKPDLRDSMEGLRGLLFNRHGIPLSAGSQKLGHLQCFVETRCEGPFFQRQMAVPGAHRQAVPFAYRRNSDNFYWYVQVEHQAPHDRQLLIVFFPEERQTWLQHLEEFHYYGRDASKVTRAMRTTEVFRDLSYFDERTRGLRVHLLVGRGKDVIDSSFPAELDILRQRPRITVVIAFLIELNWIDEDTGDDHGAAVARFL